MANMRVYELAKELNITTKDIADLLDNNNKTYKTMSGLNDDEVQKSVESSDIRVVRQAMHQNQRMKRQMRQR